MKSAFTIHRWSNLNTAKVRRTTLFLVSALFLSSCVDTQVLMLEESQTFEPTSNVGILYRNPSRPFLTIATIESSGTMGTTHSDVLKEIREKAKGLGAHAIIITPAAENRDAQSHEYSPFFDDYKRLMNERPRNIRATAIRFFSGQVPTASWGAAAWATPNHNIIGQPNIPGVTLQLRTATASLHKTQQAMDALVRGDSQEALEILEPLAEKGNSRAQAMLGDMFSTGGAIPRNYLNALKWYGRAAAQGEANAQFGLGLLFMEGRGSTRDTETANKWFVNAIPQLSQSADVGNHEAQFNLAVANASGYAFRKNPNKALALLNSSGEGGFYRAQLVLAYQYLENKNLEIPDIVDLKRFSNLPLRKDDAEAAKWFIRMAKQGNGHAASIVGDLFFEGIGVPRDPAKSAEWYQRAAESGNPKAQVRLALAYLNGEGVPRDDVQGLRLLKSAADQKLAFAQEQMGYLYMNGQGVNQSLKTAIQWFYKAGINYQENGKKERATSMVVQIEKLSPNDNLAKGLRTRISRNY